MTEAISSEQERQLAQQHDELFAPHRAALRTQLFPESTLVNTSTHRAVNCWTADSRVFKPLLDALPFGVILRADHYANFRDHALNLIPDLARKQLLFWQLDRPLTLGEPIQALTLAEEEANLWHEHVVPNEFEYQQALVGGERLRFLTCFHLDYTRIRITLAGVRLRSTPEPFGQTSYAFVQCDDREYTYVWTEQRWDVSIDSNDPRTVNPEIFSVPAPLRPSDNLGVPVTFVSNARYAVAPQYTLRSRKLRLGRPLKTLDTQLRPFRVLVQTRSLRLQLPTRHTPDTREHRPVDAPCQVLALSRIRHSGFPKKIATNSTRAIHLSPCTCPTHRHPAYPSPRTVPRPRQLSSKSKPTYRPQSRCQRALPADYPTCYSDSKASPQTRSAACRE